MAEQKNSNVGNISEEADGSNELLTKTRDSYRAGFQIASKKKFRSDENPDGWVPKPNELAVDDNGVVYICAKNEMGEPIWLSPLKNLIDEYNEMKKLGIIQNAEAFRLNGKIFNFIYDNDKMVLRLNTELDYYEDYRFYSVRKINRDPITRDYVYISGVMNSETNELATNLGKINSNGERNVPAPVRMINTCKDGEKYVVDFYDDARHPIGSEIFYARSGKSVDFSLSADMAIDDLIITTDRPASEPNSCFLYQNEDPNNLVIRVGLKYVDGHIIDITEEAKTTGRLIFEGRDDLKTDQINMDLESAQEVKVVYFVDLNNSQDQPIDHNDLETLQVDPDTISLNKILKVLVKENIYDPVIDLCLQGYKDVQVLEGATDLYKIKAYAIYESGNIRDITPVMDASRFITTAGFQYNERSQCLESSKILTNFTVQCIIPQGRSVVMFKKNFVCEFSEYNRRMIINNSEGGFDTKDTLKFTLFNPTQNKMRISETDTLTTLRDKYCFKYNLNNSDYIAPTHVLIRNALDPNIIYTGLDLVDSYAALDDPNGVVNYRITEGNLIADDTPLLVEFYEIGIDPETGARATLFLTGVQRTYAKSTSVSL